MFDALGSLLSLCHTDYGVHRCVSEDYPLESFLHQSSLCPSGKVSCVITFDHVSSATLRERASSSTLRLPGCAPQLLNYSRGTCLLMTRRATVQSVSNLFSSSCSPCSYTYGSTHVWKPTTSSPQRRTGCVMVDAQATMPSGKRQEGLTFAADERNICRPTLCCDEEEGKQGILGDNGRRVRTEEPPARPGTPSVHGTTRPYPVQCRGHRARRGRLRGPTRENTT